MDKPTALRIINRHIARLLSELEDAQCPVLLFDLVKNRIQWLRSDIVNELDYRDDDLTERIPGI